MGFTNEKLDEMQKTTNEISNDLDMLHTNVEAKNNEETLSNEAKLKNINTENASLKSSKNVLTRQVKQLRPEYDKILAAEAGRGEYYKYFATPLTLQSEIGGYETALFGDSPKKQSSDFQISPEQETKLKTKITTLKAELAKAEKELDEYQKYVEKVMTTYDSTRAALRKIRNKMVKIELKRAQILLMMKVEQYRAKSAKQNGQKRGR